MGFSASGGRSTVSSRGYRWDVGTLSWLAWDGSLTTGAVTIGAVSISGIPHVIIDDVTGIQLTPLSGSASSQGNNLLLTPASGKAIRIYYMSYNPASSVDAAFRFGAAGILLAPNSVTGGAIVATDMGGGSWSLQLAVNEALYLNLSGAVATLWNVMYVEV